jgi:uncharacterized membrane protein
VLFAPGYALTAALFARADDIDGIVRATLSFGLSVAVLPILALIINALPWGIRPFPIAISLSVWILLFSSIALTRRLVLAPTGVIYTPPAISVSGWRRIFTASGRPRDFAIGWIVIGAILAVTLAMFISGTTTHQTEFYVLGKSGLAEDYPREALPGEPLTVTVGIANGEARVRTYRVEARAVQGTISVTGELLQALGPITLAPNQMRELPVSWHMARTGDDQQVVFLLFVDSDPIPYRQLQLWLNVVEPERPSGSNAVVLAGYMNNFSLTFAVARYILSY